MPRGNRYILPGNIYHITHRCHNRSFLLKAALDRNNYRNWLREAISRYKVSVLGYCLTCNHVHLILNSHCEDDVSRFMQLVQGRTAQQHNQRRHRKGAYWEDRYHCTMIGKEKYLWNCLQYIDFNMVRAGVINNPLEWEWSGYKEFLGLRKRYRILDIQTLLTMLGFSDFGQAREQYQIEMKKRAFQKETKRDPIWTESIAIGDKSFIEDVKKGIFRIRTYSSRERMKSGSTVWSLREEKSSYA